MSRIAGTVFMTQLAMMSSVIRRFFVCLLRHLIDAKICYLMCVMRMRKKLDNKKKQFIYLFSQLFRHKFTLLAN